MNTDADTRPHVLVLGSGTSTGVPLIGCRCAVCSSTDPHDNRLRSGVYITWRGFAVQLDVSPDFRQQALRHGIERVDALLITHPHADHLLGLDEIRRFNTIQHSRITAYARDFTLEGISKIFSYIYAPKPAQKGMYRPEIDFREVGDEPVQIGPFSVSSLELPHGPEKSTAFKLTCEGRSFVYAPDCSAVTDDFAGFMEGAECVMLDGLRDRPHPSHLVFDVAVDTLAKAGVKRGLITHIGHDVAHAELERRFPAHIRPAYDGMEFTW